GSPACAARNRHVPAGVRNDRPADGQAQTIAVGLRREKRFFDIRHVLCGNSATGIPDDELQFILDKFGLDSQSAAGGHSVLRISDKIQKDLLQIALSDSDVRKSIDETNIDRDVLTLEGFSQDRKRIIESAPHVRLRRTLYCASRQSEHSAKNPPAGL